MARMAQHEPPKFERGVEMQIESVDIQNYCVFRHARLEKLLRVLRLLGTSTVGESTSFNLFAFLKDALALKAGNAANRGGEVCSLIDQGCHWPIKIETKLCVSGKPRVTHEQTLDETDGSILIRRDVLKFRQWPHCNPVKGAASAYASKVR
jgi:predicted ATPase